jgi:uncharacterized membrane protein YfcA
LSLAAFTLIVFLGSMGAGAFGAIVGVGGGILIIPLLTLGFGVHIHYAIGASLVAVIATSSGAAAAYLRDRLTNLRVGVLLEVATTVGAVIGVAIGTRVPVSTLFIVFGAVLLLSLIPLISKLGEELPTGVEPDRLSRALKLGSTYPDRQLGRDVAYEVTGVPAALAGMFGAGIISGMLGIGAGAFKVLSMDLAMRLPMKVSSATSNFMIGVTAAASAWVYLQRGWVQPVIAAPTALGALAGAFVGAKILSRMSNDAVRKLFLPVLAWIAIRMIVRGVRGE